MISLTLFIAAIAAVAAGSGYISGREYVYRYQGYIYSGYPDKKAQYAGQAFKSEVTVQPHGDYAIFKVGNVRYDRINGEIEDFDKYEYNYRDLPVNAEHLTKPFKVFFKNGLVTQFQVNRDEPEYSINLKRGLISLFHLNLEQEDSFQTGGANEIFKQDPDSHYYKAHEDGVLGNCETHYVIEHHPYYLTPQNNIVLNITKSRNYHNCVSAPNQVYSTFYGHECGESDHEKSHTLHGNAYYYYNIRGDRHHYVIERVNTEGEVAYTPYPVEGQTAEVYINRTLELVDEREVHEEYQPGSDVVSFYSLSYEFRHKHDFKELVDLKKPHYLYHIYGRKVPVSEISRLFQELIVVYDDETYVEHAKDKNYPAKFLELVRAFSTIGYDEIEEVYRAHADFPKGEATAEKIRSRSLFYDVLISTGTNPALIFGKYLIQNRRVAPEIALYYFQQLGLHVKEVTEVLLDEIYRLCDHAYVGEHDNVYAACYLALSNVVYDHCVARYHPEGGVTPDKTSCHPLAAVKYFNYIARHFEQTDEEYLKIALLKAAGNIGVREAIPYLRPYVEGHGNFHNYQRSVAIWSLRHIGQRFPERVRELLVPLFLNRSENYELRLAAFTILLQYNPQLHALETIARSMLREEDDQVRSYVYSTFKSLANSTHPCDRKIAKAMPYVLSIFDHYHEEFENYDYSYSHHHYVSGYDHDYDYGGSSRFAYFASDTGYIPRSAYFGVNDFIGGKSFETFGIGFKQHGLEKFWDKLFGPEGSYGQRSFFDLFKKRSPRDVNTVEKERKEIKEKLNLPVKEYEPIHGEVFFKYMGNHYSFLYFNDTTFEDFFKEGRFSIPNLPAKYRQLSEFSYQRFILAVDKLYLIPSEVGLPIIFDYKQPTYVYHKNNDLQIQVNPGFFPEERENKLPSELKVRVDGHFICDKNLFASMGVIVPFDEVTFGAGINRRCTLSLPLKVEFGVDLKDPKVTAKWVPVVPHEIYHFEYEPYTFVDSYINHVPVSAEESYLPVRREGHRRKFDKNFYHDAFGFGFNVKGDYDNEWNDFGSWFKFLAEKTYREKFYYLYANPQLEPYHYDVSITPADHDVTTEMEVQFRYSYHGDENRPYTSTLPDGEFEEYSHSRTDKNLYTSVLRGDIVAKGEKERKIHGEITYSRDLSRSYHKFNIYYDRTPFTREENDHLKVCVSGYLKYPKLDLKKVSTLDTLELDRKVESEVTAHFGKDCKTDQKITIQGRIEETEEQRDLEHRREEKDTVEHYNPYAYHYQRCQEDQKKGLAYPESCLEYMYLSTQVHKYTFHVKHEHLSPRFLNYTYKLGGFLRHILYYDADHNVIDVTNPEDELHFEANFSSIYPVADIRVRKPHSESHYNHVYVPHYHAFKAYPFYQDAHVRDSLNDHYCKIEADNVYTFDRFSYNLPPIDCYKVLSKDCSPSEHFIVLASKINHPRYHKALKVFLGKYKIEALPVSDDSDVIIRVDGKKVPVTDSEPYFHYVSEKKEPVFYITHRDFYYSILSEKYGLIVEYDGNAVSIQLSPYYRSKLCGLCGNYNGQRYDGYETENGCVIHDTDSYAYSFAIPSDTCTVPKVEPICYGEEGAGCTELRTQVLHITTGKVPQTCFSTEPVAQCKAQCTPRGHVSRTLEFHCLPAKDDSTRSLLRQQQLRILHEVRRKSKDHETSVEVPEGCHRE